MKCVYVCAQQTESVVGVNSERDKLLLWRRMAYTELTASMMTLSGVLAVKTKPRLRAARTRAPSSVMVKK